MPYYPLLRHTAGCIAPPRSVRLCEGIVDKGSEYAAEGIEPHALCEYKLKKALGMETWEPTEAFTITTMKWKKVLKAT